MEKLLIAIGTTVAVVMLGVFIALFVSIPVWLLWNWLAPAIFGLKTITWLQALGLLVLCNFLFKTHHTSSK